MIRRDRTRPRVGTTQKPTLFRSILNGFGGFPLFTANKYVEDPAHLGFVLRFVDNNDPTHWLEQTNPANQVAIPTAHADFGGQVCATFTGVEWYVSNRAASEFAYTSDGTGFSGFLVFTPTSITGAHSLFCTTSAAGSRGLAFYHSAAALLASVERTTTQAMPASSGGALSLNLPTYREISHGTARSPQWALLNQGTVTSSGAYSNPAEAGAPVHTLRLGSNSGGALPALMRWRSLLFTPGVSAAERSLVQQWIQSDTGIAP